MVLVVILRQALVQMILLLLDQILFGGKDHINSAWLGNICLVKLADIRLKKLGGLWNYERHKSEFLLLLLKKLLCRDQK